MKSRIVILGLIGLVVIVLAYFIYQTGTKQKREPVETFTERYNKTIEDGAKKLQKL